MIHPTTPIPNKNCCKSPSSSPSPLARPGYPHGLSTPKGAKDEVKRPKGPPAKDLVNANGHQGDDDN